VDVLCGISCDIVDKGKDAIPTRTYYLVGDLPDAPPEKSSKQIFPHV